MTAKQKTPRQALKGCRGVVKVAIIAVLNFSIQHGESTTKGNIWQIAMISCGIRLAVFGDASHTTNSKMSGGQNRSFKEG